MVVDRFNKYGHFLPLKHPYTAQLVAQVFLDTIIRIHGLLDAITSDRDAVYLALSRKNSSLCKVYCCIPLQLIILSVMVKLRCKIYALKRI